MKTDLTTCCFKASIFGYLVYSRMFSFHICYNPPLQVNFSEQSLGQTMVGKDNPPRDDAAPGSGMSLPPTPDSSDRMHSSHLDLEPLSASDWERIKQRDKAFNHSLLKHQNKLVIYNQPPRKIRTNIGDFTLCILCVRGVMTRIVILQWQRFAIINVWNETIRYYCTLARIWTLRLTFVPFGS